MTWNHRVVRAVQNGEEGYSIREVFYNDDGSISMWTKDPIDPYGETLDGLRLTLERMLECLDKPVLDEQELEARFKKIEDA